MRDPLAAHHELELGLLPECIAHPAMEARDAHARCYGTEQGLELLGGDLAHRPLRHDQVEALELLRVEKSVQHVGDLHLKAFITKSGTEDVGHLLRLVAIPAAPDDQCLLHVAPSPVNA